MTQTVLLDANVLYSASLRDVLMQLALEGLFRARWTDKIHDEWINAILRNRPQIPRTQLEHVRDLMNRAILDATISSYEDLIPNINLPDPDDRHVLAAAITGKCQIIVTKNLQDFPENVLTPYGIRPQQPDDFLLHHLQQSSELFCAAIRKIRARLKNPSYSVPEYLDILTVQGLVVTSSELKQFSNLL